MPRHDMEPRSCPECGTRASRYKMRSGGAVREQHPYPEPLRMGDQSQRCPGDPNWRPPAVDV